MRTAKATSAPRFAMMSGRSSRPPGFARLNSAGRNAHPMTFRCVRWASILRKTPLGSDVAGLVLSKRRDHATIVLDMGGGYGGGVYQTLLESIDSSEIVTYKGAEKSTHRTAEKKLGFINKRSETYWKFREALNPDQLHGSPIALPEDPMLVADLTAPKYEIGPRGIQITEKTELVKSLGRSPDRGDAVVMCWAAGARHATHGRNWEQGGRLNAPRVDLGRRHNRAGTPGVDLGRRR
jgi:hypothetical protein